MQGPKFNNKMIINTIFILIINKNKPSKNKAKPSKNISFPEMFLYIWYAHASGGTVVYMNFLSRVT